MCGYVVKSHRTKVCNRIASQRKDWRDMARQMGWHPDEVMGDSFHSHVCSTAALAVNKFEQEYWCVTRMFLRLVLFWQKKRKEKEIRVLCSKVGVHILQMTCLPEQILVEVWVAVRLADKQACCHGQVNRDDQCLCLTQALNKFPNFASCAPQERLWNMMFELSKADACPACDGILARALETVAIVLEALWDVGG